MDTKVTLFSIWDKIFSISVKRSKLFITTIIKRLPFSSLEVIKTPPASVLIRKAAGLEKGSGNPLKNKVGTISKAQLRAIAEQKMPDLNANSIEMAEKIVAGTARSMGVEIK